MLFHFAWCGPDEDFSDAHLREDEAILTFDITHQEGQIPTLDIEVENPHVGLLAPGRAQWAWFSWEADDGEVTPLFYGRLIALPSNLLGEAVTLKFVARPTDYLAQKQDLAESLKVSPYYDPIWINQDSLGDPDTVLETYACSWHVDRYASEVSISDIIFGEDGTEEFREEDSFYDSVSIEFSQAPQNQVIFDGKVEWTQEETGIVALPDTHVAALNAAQIVDDTPGAGTPLGSGWSVASSSVTSNAVTGTSGGVVDDQGVSLTIQYKNYEKIHLDGDLLTFDLSQTGFCTGYPINVTGGGVAGDVWQGIAGEGQYSATFRGTKVVPADAPFGTDTGSHPDTHVSMSLQYQMQRGRTEYIKFVMTSELQPIVTVAEDEPFNPINISMQGTDLNLPLDGTSSPIVYAGRSSFFPTERGLQSIIYPMLIARAHLLQSARAVKVSFNCTFERAINLSCRMNALLHDHRLPGGQVIGKITEYHISGSGDSGELIGKVQIESTIGTGDVIFVSEGNPTYVDEAYVAVGYQFYENADLTLPTDDLTIEIPTSFQVDDGLVTPLTSNQVLGTYRVHRGATLDNVAATFSGGQAFAPTFSTDISSGGGGSVESQYQRIISASARFDQAIRNAVITNPTWIEIDLVPVSGQCYHAEYDLGAAFLTVPKLIDLEAANA